MTWCRARFPLATLVPRGRPPRGRPLAPDLRLALTETWPPPASRPSNSSFLVLLAGFFWMSATPALSTALPALRPSRHILFALPAGFFPMPTIPALSMAPAATGPASPPLLALAAGLFILFGGRRVCVAPPSPGATTVTTAEVEGLVSTLCSRPILCFRSGAIDLAAGVAARFLMTMGSTPAVGLRIMTAVRRLRRLACDVALLRNSSQALLLAEYAPARDSAMGPALRGRLFVMGRLPKTL
eukprot:CAMPEP_0117569844 /NCGR_PEP_ID=MMETSP0784-20121206/58876_1 /TAXON_ID=39447 /ORGANISM="" /LENGTH=241 /DNA_ID=CAMNT_0005367847 /DNA_START=511 /DNA_END=1233 /DNA_ORIENTATION=-